MDYKYLWNQLLNPYYIDEDDDKTPYYVHILNAFGIDTYDEGVDSAAHYIGKKFFKAFSYVLNRTTFDHLEGQTEYKETVEGLVLMDLCGLIEWGTSIRGAWLDYEFTDGHEADIKRIIKQCIQEIEDEEKGDTNK